MQTQKTITLFATVSNSACSRSSKNDRNYTAFWSLHFLRRPGTRPFTTTSLPSASRATSLNRCRRAHAIKLVTQAQISAR